jgi:hypothetical protein
MLLKYNFNVYSIYINNFFNCPPLYPPFLCASLTSSAKRWKTKAKCIYNTFSLLSNYQLFHQILLKEKNANFRLFTVQMTRACFLTFLVHRWVERERIWIEAISPSSSSPMGEKLFNEMWTKQTKKMIREWLTKISKNAELLS